MVEQLCYTEGILKHLHHKTKLASSLKTIVQDWSGYYRGEYSRKRVYFSLLNNNMDSQSSKDILSPFNNDEENDENDPSSDNTMVLLRQGSKRSTSMPRMAQSVIETIEENGAYFTNLSIQDKREYMLSQPDLRARVGTIGTTSGRQRYSTLASQGDISKSTVMLNNIGTPSESEIKATLKKWAKKKFGYRKTCIREMAIKDVRMRKAYQYSLETFVETRDVNVAHEPCAVVSRGKRPTSSLWEIECSPNSMFQSGKGKVEVPGSAELVVCTCCEGLGFIYCPDCGGKGITDCTRCEGTGYKLSREPLAEQLKHGPCYICAAEGTVKCMFCDGCGRRKCLDCKGQRTLKKFLQLTVRFTNVSTSQIVSDRLDLLEERLSKVSGLVICEREAKSGKALEDFPHLDVYRLSQRLLTEHQKAAEDAGARILRQRQKVYLVPVTEVYFRWRGKDGRFWLYGIEKKCFCPDYPQKLCSIL